MKDREFIPYEQALELKELGFDESCLGYYHTTLGSSNIDLIIGKTPDWFYHLISLPEHFDTLAPTFSQAYRWFREKGIESEIHSDFDRMLGYNRGYIPVVQFIEFYNNGDCYDTYEEAQFACIKKLIEIVKQPKP